MSPFYGVRLKKARPTHVSTAYLGLRGPPRKSSGYGRPAEPAIEGFVRRASPSPRAVVDPDCGIYTKLVAKAHGSLVIERSSITLSGSNPMDFTEADDPIALFRLWLEEATGAEINDPEAMTLCTAGADGLPDARMVLCKGADERGLVFYTNAESAKGRELAARPEAAALFHWKSLRRQVRFRGPVAEVSDAEADAYFATRARRAGSAPGPASSPVRSNRGPALEAAAETYAKKFGDGDIPRPAYWRGYRITPVEIEFWRDGAFRLHDRIRFRRANTDSPWRKERLYP